MNLNLLRVFVQVVEAESFTRAAEALDISQPAVSRAIRELEAQLDTVLLERQGRGFKASEAGRVLFDYGRSIFALERKADEALRSFWTVERGRLTIGASTTIAGYWLPPLLARFQRKYPMVEICLVSANTAQVADLLLECRVDVALVEGQLNDERLDIRPWRSEPMVVLAPKGPAKRGSGLEGAVDLRKMADATWVVREPGSGSRNVTEHALDGLGLSAVRRMEVGSNEAIVQSVAAGLGLGIVPRICARDQLALGRVRAIATDLGVIERSLFRVRLPQRPLSHAAVAFEALLA